MTGYPPDTLAGLFLIPDTGLRAPPASLGAGGEGILTIRAPPGRYLLSLEQWCPAERWAARVRHGIGGEAVPPDVPHLSDLLLVKVAEILPESLDDALPRTLTSTELVSEGSVTVAWEVYGLGLRREPLTFRLSLVEEGESLVRRALKKVGLLRKEPVLTLSWTEEGAARSGPFFRAVDLELPSLDPGPYLLRLELAIPYRNPVVSHRRVVVS